MVNSRIIGVGHFLPKKIMKNSDLTKIVDTSEEWITSRTGINQRHIASKGELTSALATSAAKEAIKNANIKSSDIDFIILATTTPDETFPATASIVQKNLDIGYIPSFDIQAVCSGFIYAIQMGDALIKSNKAKNVLVIGAETLSNIVDWSDRRTCVLFGDGAGAIILNAEQNKEGVMATNLFSDGTWHDSLYADGGPSLNQKVGKIRMKGKDIFKQAVNKLSESTLKSLEDCQKTIEDIDWLIPHQANFRIINLIIF